MNAVQVAANALKLSKRLAEVYRNSDRFCSPWSWDGDVTHGRRCHTLHHAENRFGIQTNWKHIWKRLNAKHWKWTTSVLIVKLIACEDGARHSEPFWVRCVIHHQLCEFAFTRKLEFTISGYHKWHWSAAHKSFQRVQSRSARKVWVCSAESIVTESCGPIGYWQFGLLRLRRWLQWSRSMHVLATDASRFPLHTQSGRAFRLRAPSTRIQNSHRNLGMQCQLQMFDKMFESSRPNASEERFRTIHDAKRRLECSMSERFTTWRICQLFLRRTGDARCDRCFWRHLLDPIEFYRRGGKA